MKSEHRHELKQNELADWLTHLPQWTKENLSFIITVIAAIVIVAIFYGWRSLSKNVQSGEHEKFTSLVDDILFKKAQIVSQSGSDMSYLLSNNATDLEGYAGKTSDKNIAALALVKAGDSVRSELQYRPETINQKTLTEKIEKARKDYTDAIAKQPSDKTIKGLAEYGLGLCAEELGNFDEARKIYSGIVENADYAGTINVNKAQLRLNIMDDNKQDIVFQLLPLKPLHGPNDVNNVLDPLTELMRKLNKNTGDANLPLVIDSTDANLPADINFPSDTNNLEK